MQILSVNVACREILATPNGDVETGILKRPVAGPVTVTTSGLEGDAIVDTSVHGGPDQAVYLYSQEDYDWWEQQLGRSLAPGLFGENLTIGNASTGHSSGGAPRAGCFRIGDRLHINDVILEITAPRIPCFKLATRMGDAGFIKAFVRAARPGAYARVIAPGRVSAGDPVLLFQAPEAHPAVAELFVECHTKVHSAELLERALAAPLGQQHRAIIQGHYDRL